MMRFKATVAALAVFAVSLVAPAARAEPTETTATAKGITGGALLGAELVMVSEAAFNVKKPWVYAVGGGLGAIGGGVGGYFVEGSADPKISVYMLAAGMALIIPSTVAVLSAAAYEPPADWVQDEMPADEPVADPVAPAPASEGDSSAPEPTSRAPVRHHRVRRLQATPFRAPLQLYTPPALVGFGTTSRGLELSLSVPSVELRTSYSRRELAEFGVQQRTEVRVPVLSVVF